MRGVAPSCSSTPRRVTSERAANVVSRRALIVNHMVHCMARIAGLQADGPRAQIARSCSVAPSPNCAYRAQAKFRLAASSTSPRPDSVGRPLRIDGSRRPWLLIPPCPSVCFTAKHQTAMGASPGTEGSTGVRAAPISRERHAFMPPLGDHRSLPQITRPPRMVSRTRAKAAGSLAGSPSRSTRSASMPGAMRPLCAA